MLKVKNVKTIELQDWDALVQETYGRIYSFQQQDGCRYRGTVSLRVPSPDADESFVAESISDKADDHDEMGVKFSSWLARDPQKPLVGQQYEWQLGMWWERNFYPNLGMVVNDLHAKGLIEAGEYVINIDW